MPPVDLMCGFDFFFGSGFGAANQENRTFSKETSVPKTMRAIIADLLKPTHIMGLKSMKHGSPFKRYSEAKIGSSICAYEQNYSKA